MSTADRPARGVAASAALLLVLAAGTLCLWVSVARHRDTGGPLLLGAPLPPTAGDEPPVVVHVAGAVKQPGVYRFRGSERVVDAVRRAGGPAPGARLNDLNLAAHLKDGIRLYVPGPRDGPRDELILVTDDIYVKPPPEPRPPDQPPTERGPQVTDVGAATRAEKPPASGRKLLPAGRVNLNTASLEELMTLPGVGEVTARRILAYRAAHGPFRDPRGLLQVRGIGDKTYAKLAPYLSVE
ncbi:MAG: ComEA family DNA-binding protein [Armatimonadetes bacterium]|nr:ComEA family DNA-binding protein [Armatimonadota bacterium]